MSKEQVLVMLGALQMIEPIIKNSNDNLAIDAFCSVWNTLAEIAYPTEMGINEGIAR